MDIIENTDMRDVYHCICTIDNVLKKSIQLAEREKSYINQMVPEELRDIYSKKQNTAQKFVDNISRLSYEASLVMLVATFERIIFAKYKTTYGTIKSFVGAIPSKGMDYYKSREQFVDGSADKLHAIIKLVEEHIDYQLIQKLKMIKDHRDFVAHGKRFGESPVNEFELKEIAITLDRIITEIEKN